MLFRCEISFNHENCYNVKVMKKVFGAIPTHNVFNIMYSLQNTVVTVKWRRLL